MKGNGTNACRQSKRHAKPNIQKNMRYSTSESKAVNTEKYSLNWEAIRKSRVDASKRRVEIFADYITDRIPDGQQRHAFLLHWGGVYREKGFNSEELEMFLQRLNAKNCVPPKTPDELRELYVRLEEYRGQDHKGKGTKQSAQTPKPSVKSATPESTPMIPVDSARRVSESGSHCGLCPEKT